MTMYAIEQRIVLSPREVHTFLVLLLPNGKETRVPIEADVAAEILGELRVHADVQVENSAQPEPPPPPEKEKEESDAVVHWASLPDGVLSPLMKAALAQVGLPTAVPVEVLMSAVEGILQRFTEDDWGRLKSPQEIAPMPAPPPAPPVGAVQWADGRPIIPSAAAPSKTVQKDEMGYPCVSKGEVDPVEVLGGDMLADDIESGVDQL